MIIELAGLPGSGKTTLSRLLERELPALHRAPLPVTRAPGLGHLPALLRESLRLAGIGPGRGWPAWPRLWSAWRAQLTWPDVPDRVVLLEEGLAHLTWRALFRHPSLMRAPWQPFLALPHHLVVLETPSAERRVRVEGKARKGRVNRALAATGEEWARGEALWEIVLAATPGTRVVHRVDTSGSPSEAAARLAGVIRSWPSGGTVQRQQAQAQR